MSLIFSITSGFQVGALATASFAQGDKNKKRFWAFINCNFLLCCGFALVFEILFLSIPHFLLKLFGVPDDVMDLGSQLFRIALSGTLI